MANDNETNNNNIHLSRSSFNFKKTAQPLITPLQTYNTFTEK
jgi:hypothetical protein